eukprot:14749765-Alexandrium_andersonii.AAC.1
MDIEASIVKGGHRPHEGAKRSMHQDRIPHSVLLAIVSQARFEMLTLPCEGWCARRVNQFARAQPKGNWHESAWLTIEITQYDVWQPAILGDLNK